MTLYQIAVYLDAVVPGDENRKFTDDELDMFGYR